VLYLLLAVPSCLKVALMNRKSSWTLSALHNAVAPCIKVEKMACVLEGW